MPEIVTAEPPGSSVLEFTRRSEEKRAREYVVPLRVMAGAPARRGRVERGDGGAVMTGTLVAVRAGDALRTERKGESGSDGGFD